MAAATLDDFICVPIPSELYQSLASRFPDGVSSVLESITWDFLERTEDDFISTPAEGGIRWGSISLPNGTQLRVKKSRSNDYGYAEVTGEKIIYLGKVISSPSQFARTVKDNTSVNAWINIEVKRPQDRGWKLADSFR